MPFTPPPAGFRLIAAILLVLPVITARAQDTVPAEFRGDWVPVTAACDSQVRLRVEASQLTLINGKDTQSWGNVGVPTSFFGPSYNGISVIALPDWDSSQPFTVYFNADEKKGVTKVNIYTEMKAG